MTDQAERIRAGIAADWTTDPETGRSNNSPEFLRLVDAVDRLIRESAFFLITGRSHEAARLIMAQLAHVHGLRPGDGPLPLR